MKSLTLVPIGGLANRFYAITSAIAFCRDHDITLRVIWFKDKGMGADFHSLFELSETVDKHKVEIVDAKWFHYLYDRPRKKNLWLPWIWQKIYFNQRLLEKDAYDSDVGCVNKLKMCKKTYFVAFYPFYSTPGVLLNLSPKYEIRQKIEKYKSNLRDNVIGIHIRRTDNIASINKSPLSLFINKISEEIRKDSNVLFYVASDSDEVKLVLKREFGEKVVYANFAQRRDTLEGITDAMIELYTLASTKKIYGSFASTYSNLAAAISDIDLEVLST
nr:hypothetical protein [Parabacteroides goldsteinii]